MGKKTPIMEYLSELIHSEFENRKPAPIPESITIEQLEDVARRGHITYLVIGALLKLDLPEEVVNRFRSYMIKSTFQTLAQVCAVKDLHKAFEEEGIRHQVLKGSVLKHLYPSPEMREMSDIDIMVYENTLDRAEVTLLRMGYDKYKNVKHHVIFTKNPSLVLEAHWTLYDQNVDKGQFLYYKDNFRAQLVEGTEYTYDFSKEDFYVYMISHMAKHFFETGCGIRNLLDIYVYNKAYKGVLNRKLVDDELKKLGLADFEKHADKLARIWLAGEETSEFYNTMFEYMLDCGIYGKGENGIWGQMAKSSDALQSDKKIVLSTYMFPPLDYMKEQYRYLEKMPWLLPVAWILRGVRGIADKGSKERLKLVSGVEDEKAAKIGNLYKQLKLNFKNV